MSKFYWIGTVEEYEYQLTKVIPDGRVSKHAPIYNKDNTEVLVAGYGDLTMEQVSSYQENNDWYGDVVEDI